MTNVLHANIHTVFRLQRVLLYDQYPLIHRKYASTTFTVTHVEQIASTPALLNIPFPTYVLKHVERFQGCNSSEKIICIVIIKNVP